MDFIKFLEEKYKVAIINDAYLKTPIDNLHNP